MKKWICTIAAMIIGIVICAIAPSSCLLIGAFLIGSGAYAATEILKVQHIAREITRYETLSTDACRPAATAVAEASPPAKAARRRAVNPVFTSPRFAISEPRILSRPRVRGWIVLLGQRCIALSDWTGLPHTIFLLLCLLIPVWTSH